MTAITRLAQKQPLWAYRNRKRVAWLGVEGQAGQVIFPVTGIKIELDDLGDHELTWVKPLGRLQYEEYLVESRRKGQTFWNNRGRVETLGADINVVNENIAHEYRITPISETFGAGLASVVVEGPLSDIPKPDNPTITVVDHDTVRGTIAARDNSTYQWQYVEAATLSDLQDADWTDPIASPSNQYTFESLTASTAYAFRVRYVAGARVGAWSGAVFAVTESAPDFSPSSVGAVTLNLTSAGVASIRFSAATPKPNTRILRYEATLIKGLFVITITVQPWTNIGTATSYTFTSRATEQSGDNRIRYVASVRAVAADSRGNEYRGPARASNQIQFPLRPPPPPPVLPLTASINITSQGPWQTGMFGDRPIRYYPVAYVISGSGGIPPYSGTGLRTRRYLSAGPRVIRYGVRDSRGFASGTQTVTINIPADPFPIVN